MYGMQANFSKEIIITKAGLSVKEYTTKHPWDKRKLFESQGTALKIENIL
jgi:hypothetical protein